MTLREGELPRTARPFPTKRVETKKQRKERLAKERAKRLQLRERLVDDDDAVLTFKEWCGVCGISERQGRRIIALGNGPTVTQLSDRRIGISRRNNREWQEKRAR